MPPLLSSAPSFPPLSFSPFMRLFPSFLMCCCCAFPPVLPPYPFPPYAAPALRPGTTLRVGVDRRAASGESLNTANSAAPHVKTCALFFYVLQSPQCHVVHRKGGMNRKTINGCMPFQIVALFLPPLRMFRIVSVRAVFAWYGANSGRVGCCVHQTRDNEG